jgi:endoglucanase
MQQQFKRCPLGTAVVFSLSLPFSANALECEYSVGNDWGSGFVADITLTNDTNETVTGWEVVWSYQTDAHVTNIWNASLVSDEPLRATNVSWNANIAPGSSISFGFQGEGEHSDAIISQCGLEADGGDTGGGDTGGGDTGGGDTGGGDTGGDDGESLTSVELTQLMGVGWNAGNSLDAVGGETAWGNPLLTQDLFTAVKAAGFDTVRLPVAWSKFSDETNFIIKNSWMARVEEVVNYALNADLYVMMNIHWDNGWMQPTYDEQDYVNNRLNIMWEQIATHFKDYDDRLLFAGTNEVMVEGDWGTPVYEYYTVQNSYNQTFVDTVRNTGGNNDDRFLVVQGFNTNIDHAVNFAQMPTDSANDRLLMEIHYYDPYNFTLNTESNITQWGAIATDLSKTDDWGNETHADAQFQKMKSRFIDEGIGVILGEYGVISRSYVPAHETYRTYWNKYITESAIAHGLVPVYWDNGYRGENSFAIFDRATALPLYPDIIEAITGAVQ